MSSSIDTTKPSISTEQPSKKVLSAETPGRFHNQYLLNQTNVMFEFAMENALEVPTALIKNYSVLSSRATQGLTEEELEDLASNHQQLRRIVAPATPQALLLIESERKKNSFLSFIALVPIVRHILVISVFFLCAFILIGQLDIVNQANVAKGILTSSGIETIAVLMYLISCAGLGACFTSLYGLTKYVSDANYDPRYNSTYWASILLGIIAGLFISELFYASLVDNEDGAEPGGLSTITALGKPALALLGGFSANMVHGILQRLVDAIGSIFRADQGAIVKAQRSQEAGELKQKQDQLHMNTANQLVALSELMEHDPEQAKAELKTTIKKLLKT